MLRFGFVFLVGSLFEVGDVNAEPARIEPDVCLDVPFTGAVTPAQIKIRDLVFDLRSTLEEFPSLLSVLETGDLHICLAERLVTEMAYFDIEADRIVLSADMSRDLSRIVLVHELRHADQVARGICPAQSLAMEEYARGVLALEADANVVAALVAWKRMREGDASLWKAFEGWPKTSDIAARFAAVMTESGDVAKAATAAFDQWYVSEARTELYYVASCSHYLDRQDQDHKLPEYLKLADDYFDRLCVLPDGRDYDCRESDLR